MQLHIIYTDSQMLISKMAYRSWQEIQDQFANYKASLGPWDSEAVIEFLIDEYSFSETLIKSQIETFLLSSEPFIEL